MKRDPSELLRDGLCSNQTLVKEEAVFGGLRVTVVRKSSLASIPSTEASCYQGQFRLPAFIIAIVSPHSPKEASASSEQGIQSKKEQEEEASGAAITGGNRRKQTWTSAQENECYWAETNKLMKGLLCKQQQ